MLDAIAKLHQNIAGVFLGHEDVVRRVIVCLMARGHILIEDVPGVGKTLLASTLARSIDGSFARVQMTPDLLPSDILGVTILDRASSEFIFKPGPIFSNVVLADEVNRTTPRTQAALLEAMNEASVSVEGQARKLDQPFLVIATQNPAHFEGTYPLPESQLDRFLMRLHLGYPKPEEESRILEARPQATGLANLRPVISRENVREVQALVDRVWLHEDLRAFIVAIAAATRTHPNLELGLSPRGSLALAQAARATAAYHGRDYAVPEDVTSNVLPVVGHRLVVRGMAPGGPSSGADRILEEILRSIPTPMDVRPPRR
ncbi:MAG: MoxR family ATPase [Planctomycetota bacterium]|nr:MoxR family ATPase [Planctomycetota bacterium]